MSGAVLLCLWPNPGSLCVAGMCGEWNFLSLLCLVRVEMDCKLERGVGTTATPPG